jgi:hypothetical protein
MRGLGIVLTPFGKVPGAYPWEIAKTVNGRWGQYLGPLDRQHYTHGEAGYYYDSPLGGLGAIPTDAELGPARCATPVHSGWIESNQGYLPPPWVPPGRYDPAGAYGPAISLGEIVVDQVERHNQRMFQIGLWTALAATTVAVIHILRYTKGR